MLNFFKHYQLAFYKTHIFTYVLNFRLFNFTTYLTTRVSNHMSVFFLQLNALINKNIVVLNRVFFVEVIFKR